MFGMGFIEILIILVIAILFLGPEKLPTAIVDIAKFFKQIKTTVGSMKDSLEEEMNVTELKEEALSYKKQLFEAQESLKKVVDLSALDDELPDLDNAMKEEIQDTKKVPKKVPKETPQEIPKVEETEAIVAVKEEVITFKKKNLKEENRDV